MKKFLLSSVILLIVFSSAWAVPALRRTVVHEQPDGTKIALQMHGDEYFHYFVDEKGKYVVKDSLGFFKTISTKQFQQIQKRHLAKAKKAPQKVTQPSRNIVPRPIVLLVQFADVKFNKENTKEAYNDMLNGSNANTSAKEYFRHQSAGKYVPQFDVIGPITVSQKLAYYGGNDRWGEDKNVEAMVTEACKLAQKDFNVDFGLYDNDGDTYVDIVYIIYAGHSEADMSGAAPDAIWPHQYTVSMDQQYGKTKKVWVHKYACSSELNWMKTRDGIGTFCHEFSHVLGLPDFYSTDESTTHETLGSWDIMDYGPYNNNGNTPPNYSAYERWFMGWLKPTVLKGEKKVSLNDIDSHAAGLIFEEEEHNMDALNPSPTTFYLLENRQQKNWDEYLKGHGLMITKVKFDASKWYNNTVNNNPDDMGVDLIEAGESGGKDSRDLPTELFPAGATSYLPFMDYSITNIIEENGVITFDFKGGKEHLKLDIDDILANDPEATIFDVMGNRIERKDVKTGVVYILRQNGQVQKFQIK